MRFSKTSITCIKEPLLSPFGFKGNYVSELWQIVVKASFQGTEVCGLGVQSPLWSDAQVFDKFGAAGSNNLMLEMTTYALQLARNIDFMTPDELLNILLPDVLAYGKEISGVASMRSTFALNALVPIDLAAWVLYARMNGLNRFEEIIPLHAREAMSIRQGSLGRIPLITYGLQEDDIQAIIGSQDFFLKIKIGSDPNHTHDPKDMLQWDKDRLQLVHRVARDCWTPYTESGHILYYLDANGRYPSKDMVLDLLDYADQIGALERIVIFEEPFPEDQEIFVGDLPVRIAADESAHTIEDVVRQIQMGYKAIAVKPIAKTLSMTFRMLSVAYRQQVLCFCADLTVNPVMLEWNKNVACRIPLLPGLKIGVVETNGHQNYQNWLEMEKRHPYFGRTFTIIKNGCFNLGHEFYQDSGGIFQKCSY